MSEAFNGAGGFGSVIAYIVPRGYLLRLEMITFALATDATAGIHKAKVTLTDSALGAPTAFLRDLNEGGPSQTLRYTYGIGLSGSACVTVTGWEMTDALPDTILAPQTTITVSAVNDAGTTITGDSISSVVLFGDLVQIEPDNAASLQLDAGLLPAAS